MPGKLWREIEGVGHEAEVYARGGPSASPQDFVLADSLDRHIDRALDEAERLRAQLSNEDVPEPFTRAWAIGRALRSSGLLEDPALSSEAPGFLWQVMAAKAVASVRADGTREKSWEGLRPVLDPQQPRARQGSKKGEDYWSMCVWLAEQEYGDAVTTFGGSIRNVWQMLDRKTLAPLVLRVAIREWVADLPAETRARITSTREFPELMKALVHRWPARGRRPALQPVHYDHNELRAEVERVAVAAGLP